MPIDIFNADNELLCSNSMLIDRHILEQSRGELYIKTLIPIVDVVSVWHPAERRLPAPFLPWFIEFDCGANIAYPMFVFPDKNYRAAYSIGLTNCIDDCHCSAKMNQELCCYEVVFHIAVTAETEPFEIFFDQSHDLLADVLHRYRNIVMPQTPNYPAGAWEPVYCTWYAVHTALTGEYLKSNAAEAARLGFGTFIVDDGWCFDENKRVTPETLPDWYRDIGDWQLSENKLPGMKSIVDEAQKLGLNYMFWVAPFFAGRRSRLNEKVSRYLTDLHEGQRIVDPADTAASLAAMENILSVFKDMELDGLKIDFLDTVLPDVKNPHCRRARKYIEELVGRIRAIKPEALIEFRQNYATAINAGLATAFRAADVPFDYMDNFNECLQLRLHLGDKVPIHADPVYFNNLESVETVGRHMIASLAGVPMLSMELSSIADEHKKVIANYIAFYREHQGVLNFGHWFIESRNGSNVFAKCSNENETVIILADEMFAAKALQDCSGKVIVLNLAGESFSADGAVFDAQGNPLEINIVLPGGRVELQ